MRFSLLVVLAILLAACAPAAAPAQELQVVATNPILGDVIAAVGGEHIALTVLIPAGVDPHAYEATPQDAARLESANLVFVNGLGLEEGLQQVLHEAEEAGTLVVASEGIRTLTLDEDHDDDYEHEGEGHDHDHEHEGEGHDHEHEGEEHDHEHEGEGHDHEHEGEEHDHEGHHHSGEDPHVWMNPLNLIVWVDNIASALSQADPANADAYAANASAYTASLQELDAWIVEQVATVPVSHRKLVTDHATFGYFAAAYGFESVGSLIGSFSSLSEASAGELAELQHAMEDLGIRSIFISGAASQSLADRVSGDTGIQVVTLYVETLSPSDGPAATYLEMMRYNVSAIVQALQ